MTLDADIKPLLRRLSQHFLEPVLLLWWVRAWPKLHGVVHRHVDNPSSDFVHHNQGVAGGRLGPEVIAVRMHAVVNILLT